MSRILLEVTYMYKKLLVSNTSINTFYNQKDTYRNKYVHKIKFPPSKSKHLSFGNSIHETLNQFNLLPSKEQTFSNLETLLNKSWIVEGYDSTEEMLKSFIKAKNMLIKYFNDRKDYGKLLLAEEMIFYNVNSNLTLCGKIDKVFINNDGKIELIDYKTGAHTNLMIDINTDVQLPLYILLLKHRLNITPNIVSYYYLTSNSKISLELTPDIIDVCINHLKLIINEMYGEHNI